MVARVLVPLTLAATAAGCATPAAMPGPLTGLWGGQHVGLMLTGEGGTLEYDCAAGRIDGPLVPRSDGRFEAAGTHTPATGGPERVGSPRPVYPARYSGRVSGRQMTLTVDAALPAGAVRIGPHTLRLGAEPQLLKCL